MGATYTRQSTYSDGDTITAAHTNDEFNQLLAAFQASTGHSHDGTDNEGGPITKLLGNTLTFGAGTAGTDITITFDGEANDGVLKWMEDEDYFEFSDDILVASTEKLQFRDTAIYINSSADGQLDLVADTEIQLAATTIDINGAVDISGNLTVNGTLDLADGNFTNLGSIALDTITNDGTDITLDSSGDIILDADGANVIFKDDGTSILDIANNSTDVELTVSTADKNFKIKGTDGSSAITALDIDMALNGKATFSGDVVVTGDLTITGDDLVMGTNTSGHILVADGTNFNPTAVGDLSEISTVANDDVFLAVDTSGGGLKKIQRSAVVAGLATSGAISNVVEDSSPQLGGDLDVNGNGLVSTSNGNIALTPNGSGVVRIDGSNGIDMQSGSISIKNSGTQSYVDFYCESSNAHYARLQAPAHSAFAGNITLTLPATTDTITGIAATQTLTNKTLTTPVIAEITNGSSITLNAVADIVLDAGGANVLFKDDGTEILDIGNSSGDVSFRVSTADKNFQIKGTDGSSAITALDIDMAAAGAATFNDKIIATELDISGDVDIDGTLETDALSIASTTVTSTAAELNIMDGNTSATSTTLADADRVVVNDNGTMVQVALTDFETYFESALDTLSNVTTVGALNSGSITSGFGAIDVGSSNLTATGTISLGATSFNDNNITNVGSIALDSIASDAGTGTAITFSAGNVPNTQTAGSQSGNITPDFSQYTNFILTLTGNIVLQDPGDEVAGQSGIFVFIQDGTGSRTLSHADDRYFVAGGSSITLSTAANAIDIVPYFVQADGKIHLGVAQLAFTEA